MVEGMGEVDRRGEEDERSGRVGVGCDRPHVVRLDGPPADAIVAALGAMGRGFALAGMVMLHAMTDLVRPAEEGAGQEEAGQERGDESAHRKDAREDTDPVNPQ